VIRRIVALAAGVGLLLAGTAGVASAGGKGAYVTHPKLSTSQHTRALVDSAYAGAVNPSDDLADLCYVRGTEWGGSPFWDLVYNKSTGIAGFVAESELLDPGQLFECFNTTPSVPTTPDMNYFYNSTNVNTWQHSQGLVGSLYAGPVSSSDLLLDLCRVEGDRWGPNGATTWDLVYNKATGFAGFVHISELRIVGQSRNCLHNIF
jgi:hypothetical protein